MNGKRPFVNAHLSGSKGLGTFGLTGKVPAELLEGKGTGGTADQNSPARLSARRDGHFILGRQR